VRPEQGKAQGRGANKREENEKKKIGKKKREKELTGLKF